MKGILQDARFALRMMMRSPGFTFMAALTLALGKSKAPQAQTTDLARVSRVREAERGFVGAMHKAGVGILAGSDAAVGEGMPGFGLHDELVRFVEDGLSPMDALRTATYKPAEFLGLLDTMGTLEQGKLAEMVLLDANPLDNIANTQRIDMVFTGGRVYRKPALNAILKAVEENARTN